MEAQNWFASSERDDDWKREAWRETVRAVLTTEQRAYVANIVSWLGMCTAVWFMPNRELFVLPLLMRVLAMIATRLSWRKTRRALDANEPIDRPLALLAVMLFLGGISWGLMLLPLAIDPIVHPARLVIGGGALVAVAMITSMVAPLKTATLAFIAGFGVTVCGGLFLTPDAMTLPFAAGMTVLLIGILVFAFANARQHEAAADMLVENRRLNERLIEALAHAEFMAAHDPLTGLYNRRALFEQDLIAGLGNDRAHLLIVDLDDFKGLNDTFGHDMGDRTLIAVAALMRDALRSLGEGHHFAVRIGGEEFAILLDESDDRKVLQFAEDLRKDLAKLHEELGLPPGTTNASIGITHHQREESIAGSLHRADVAMYEAKARGRNRVRREDR